MYLVGVGLHIRNEHFILVGSPSVHESIMLPYELRYILLLDYKPALSQHNINSMLYKTGSLHNRKVGFMRFTKNLFFSGIERKKLAKIEEQYDALKKLSLDEGLTALFLKQSESSGSPQSEAEDAYHVLDEMNSKQQWRDSVESKFGSRRDFDDSD